jgi:hypothetical protein
VFIVVDGGGGPPVARPELIEGHNLLSFGAWRGQGGGMARVLVRGTACCIACCVLHACVPPSLAAAGATFAPTLHEFNSERLRCRWTLMRAKVRVSSRATFQDDLPSTRDE